MKWAGNVPRVAVIGASGIGRHHAHWWAREGADVCAILGTSDETVTSAKAGLLALFAFDGATYVNVDRMLAEKMPDIVDVCSPPSCHYLHARAALAAGCHVLCEKPFVYDSSLSPEACQSLARELLADAAANELELALCIQYFEAGRLMKRLWSERRGDEPIQQITGRLIAPAKGRSPDPYRVWADLAPHPISVIQALLPDARLQTDSFDLHFDGYNARARFTVRSDGCLVDCDIQTANSLGQPANTREFGINGQVFKIEADKDEENIYCARVETEDGNQREPDMMRLLIRHFLNGQILTGRDVALRNSEWLLTVLSHARCISK